MNSTWILVVQSVLIFLQIVNASNEINLAQDHRVILAAAIGAGQFFVNRYGNNITPEEKK